MKIDDSRLLLAIKKRGTIRGAAEDLYISQPAVSQRLKQIEAYWGEALFVRTSRKMIATPAGEHVLVYAYEMVKREAKIKEAIFASKSEVTGTLSLGVSTIIGQYLLPDLLVKFMRQYPKVSVDLVTGFSQMIVKGDYHLSIIRGQKRLRQTNILLFEDPLYLVYHRDVEPSNYIAFQSDEGYQTIINNWLHEQHDDVKEMIQVDQIETCKQMMIKGIGKAILPKTALQDLNHDTFQMKQLKMEGRKITRPTWLCYDEEVASLPQVKAFIHLIHTHISDKSNFK